MIRYGELKVLRANVSSEWSVYSIKNPPVSAKVNADTGGYSYLKTSFHFLIIDVMENGRFARVIKKTFRAVCIFLYGVLTR